MKVSSNYNSREITEYSNNQKTANENRKNGASKIKNSEGGGVAGKAHKLNGAEPGEIVSRQERDFFINMFPQSSEQLEKHVIFNRNGKLHQESFAKGFNLDAKI